MFSKNNPVVLLLDRGGFSLFQGTSMNILKFPFTQDIVSNLEVINKDQFLSLITSFIEKNKIYPSIIILLIADAIVYEKDLSKITPKNQPSSISSSNPNSSQKALDFANRDQQFKTEVQSFLQNIPFEEILAKVIKTETLVRLVAVNKDLVFSTTEPFIKKGFLLEAIVPCFIYGQAMNFTNGLTPDNARLVLRKQELLKLANLLTGQEQINIPQNKFEELKERDKENKHQSKRQYVLIAVFIILLIILGIVLIISGSQNKSLNTKTENPPKKSLVFPSITSIPIKSDPPIGTSSAILSTENVRVTIVQNEQSKTTQSLLREGLTKIGFKDIAFEKSGSAVPAKSSILFSKDIPSDIRQIAILEISKILPNILVLESENSDSRITILIGKS